MGNAEIREPIQKRSIEKKEKIIKAGFELICDKGYYNTNTAEIAKVAGVSTGIIYQYFKDKHDILIAGLNMYSDSVFFPIFAIPNNSFNKLDLENILKEIINKFIENHKLSQTAHEEIMAMVHSDKEVSILFYNAEIEMTKLMTELFIKNNIKSDNLKEKVHISLHLIDDLCHEVTYHKHPNMDYYKMIDIVIATIINMLN